MTKTLTEYGREVYQARGEPRKLSDLQLEISSVYATLSDQLKTLNIMKAGYWKTKTMHDTGLMRAKPLSDTSVEMNWGMTTEGQDEMKIKCALDAMEKLLSAIKNAIYVSNNEARNQY